MREQGEEKESDLIPMVSKTDSLKRNVTPKIIVIDPVNGIDVYRLFLWL